MTMLEKIIQAKHRRIGIQKHSNSFTDHYIGSNTNIDTPRFFSSLNNCSSEYKIIAEMKKASPSAGIIVDDYKPEELAAEYESKGYTNLSVLTEEDYFLGSIDHVAKVRKVCDLPILQKDFIVDEWQIYQAKTIGVDCILLISEILTKEQIDSFVKTAKTLKLDILLEFHDVLEIEKIKDVNLDFIGINNRNLRTLETDVNHCLTIRDKYQNELQKFKIIAESGFKSTMELENYRSNGIELFLIGESILKEKL
jgi:indole-3-glycerol phosphate synthase